MRKIAKLLALFYGCQILFGSLGMAMYCYVDPDAFSGIGEQSGINLRLFMLTAGLVPQAGIGLCMIWLGLPSRSRMRTWRVARTTIKQIVEN